MSFEDTRQAAAERVRAYTVRMNNRNAGPFARLVLLVLGLLIIALAIILLIPLILIAVVVALVLIAYARIRAAFSRPAKPGGEGRENVRVIRRD